MYEWSHRSMRKTAEKHFTRSTLKRGRDHEYEAAAAHRAQCRQEARTLRHLHPQAWQVRCARARAAEADHRIRSIKRVHRRNLEHARLTDLQEAWNVATLPQQRNSQGKALDRKKTSACRSTGRNHFTNKSGCHISRDPAVKVVRRYTCGHTPNRTCMFW